MLLVKQVKTLKVSSSCLLYEDGTRALLGYFRCLDFRFACCKACWRAAGPLEVLENKWLLSIFMWLDWGLVNGKLQTFFCSFALTQISILHRLSHFWRPTRTVILHTPMKRHHHCLQLLPQGRDQMRYSLHNIWNWSLEEPPKLATSLGGCELYIAKKSLKLSTMLA